MSLRWCFFGRHTWGKQWTDMNRYFIGRTCLSCGDEQMWNIKKHRWKKVK